ncbi:MAG: hypothetical protein M5U08_13965 [Burkholderiales bacterium]|nr:hypothetical protein [Burkholderiales bacterium]
MIFAIEHHDLPLLMAGMILVTASYGRQSRRGPHHHAFLNPRIRYGRSAA